VADHSTALTLFEQKRIDVMGDLSPIDLEHLSSDLRLKSFPYLKTVYLGFVFTHPHAPSLDTRKAIQRALSPSELPTLLKGRQIPARGWVPDPLRKNLPDFLGSPYSKIAPQQQSASLELVTQNWEKNLVLAQWMQEKLRKEMGLKIDILALDHKAYLEHTASKKSPLFLRSWSADYPAIENFLDVFRSLSGNNRTGWKNSEYDRLLERGRFAEAEKLLLDQAVVVPLYYEPNLFMIQNQVRGFHPNPLNIVDLRKVELSQ
jgi:ABC-type oligopeptide transport system substrate-binding subunit